MPAWSNRPAGAAIKPPTGVSIVIVDTHVHVFTDDRKKYPQIRDTARAGSIPSITEIGQTEWPLTTVEKLITMMDEAGVAKATLVQAYFVYEYDNRYTVDATLAHRDRFASIVVLDPMDRNSPDELSRLVERQGVTGLRFMRGRLPTSSLGEAATFPLWERMQSLGIPLAVNDRIAEIPRIRKAMERYPKVKVAFEHAWGHKVGAPPDYSVLEPLFAFADNPNVYIKTAINNIAAAREAGGTLSSFMPSSCRSSAQTGSWSSNYPAHPKFGGIRARLEESKKALAFLSQTGQDWILRKTALSLCPEPAVAGKPVNHANKNRAGELARNVAVALRFKKSQGTGEMPQVEKEVLAPRYDRVRGGNFHLAGNARDQGYPHPGMYLRSAFPDRVDVIEQVIAEGDRVGLLFRVTATHTGNFFGIAPTGRRVDVYEVACCASWTARWLKAGS
jgi:predicted TIM-barrel fold metal-dependent hydrolase